MWGVMWNKKAMYYSAKIKYFDNWRNYRERGKVRRTDRIFFEILTAKRNEMGTTKRRRYKIC